MNSSYATPSSASLAASTWRIWVGLPDTMQIRWPSWRSARSSAVAPG
jgi:hypothetical protein